MTGPVTKRDGLDDGEVGVATGKATERATGRAKSKGRVQGWNSREERSC